MILYVCMFDGENINHKYSFIMIYASFHSNVLLVLYFLPSHGQTTCHNGLLESSASSLSMPFQDALWL